MCRSSHMRSKNADLSPRSEQQFNYRSGDGVGGNGAPPTEIGPGDFGPWGFLRGATPDPCETTGCAAIDCWIEAGAGAVAAEFRNASTFVTKSATRSDSFFISAFWASRLSTIDWKEPAVCRSKVSKSARLTDRSPLVAAGELVAGGMANTSVRS